ncbi:hypothetical protein IJH46_02830 [Candidatus Saccharibacteria bacterium]|nr:hypothetical protein [Candidatus Saccharibacteria bacterium]
MKTSVDNISIRGEFGSATIRMRMPNGDLKRRFLVGLLQSDVVIPSKRVNRLLLETLLELDVAYRGQRTLAEANADLADLLDATTASYEGEIEDFMSEINDLQDEVNDLQADLAAMHQEKTTIGGFLVGYMDARNDSLCDDGK